jgi:hypothetical protein
MADRRPAQIIEIIFFAAVSGQGSAAGMITSFRGQL